MKTDEVREEMDRLSNDLRIIAKKLAYLSRELKRRQSAKRAKPKDHMTPEIRERVKELALEGMAARDISKSLNINSGRVSEILHGKRT